jgi:hypothetical protein
LTVTEEGVTPATPLQRFFRVRYEFADAWTTFRNGLTNGDATLTLDLDQQRFPYLFRGGDIAIGSLIVFVQLTGAGGPSSLQLEVTEPGGARSTLAFSEPAPAETIVEARWTGDSKPGKWILSAQPATFPVDRIKEVMLLLTYTVSSSQTKFFSPQKGG